MVFLCVNETLFQFPVQLSLFCAKEVHVFRFSPLSKTIGGLIVRQERTVRRCRGRLLQRAGRCPAHRPSTVLYWRLWTLPRGWLTVRWPLTPSITGVSPSRPFWRIIQSAAVSHAPCPVFGVLCPNSYARVQRPYPVSMPDSHHRRICGHSPVSLPVSPVSFSRNPCCLSRVTFCAVRPDTPRSALPSKHARCSIMAIIISPSVRILVINDLQHRRAFCQLCCVG